MHRWISNVNKWAQNCIKKRIMVVIVPQLCPPRMDNWPNVVLYLFINQVKVVHDLVVPDGAELPYVVGNLSAHTVV
jgi:hypothetical protein